MSSQVTVKLISRLPGSQWNRYFSDPQNMRVGSCRFTTDVNCTEYDWLVVYSDFPRDGRSQSNSEKLACSQKNTLLVTAEPESIKRYSKAFTNQFAYVLTSQTALALPHPQRIYSQPALTWFYGRGFNGAKNLSWDEIASPCPEKTKLISSVCSSKQHQHTLHKRRFQVTHALQKAIPELEVYGHGIRDLDDKAHALQPYKYHIAIENSIGKHHWTEKLSDAFLGGCLPFYSGCTNLEDYFPKDSYIEIDIEDTEKTAAIIREAIQENAYEKRLPAIQEARRLVLEKYNFFQTVATIIEKNHSDATDRNAKLLSTRSILLRRPFSVLPEILTWEFRKIKNVIKEYLSVYFSL